GALMAIGTVTASGEPGAPYPGDDALRDERAQLCAELLSESDLPIDPASVSGTFPDERAWAAHDRRVISCDGVPS
ncbi:hypothetical protein, partial [Ilumatobacter sp.]|uniref:hypothetical protein n=1 Tax=Ilumatobacter sp. TaxID=1967498 RepID=UPI003C646CD4